jgi:2-polyprenyl-3-methyl-5-hydroxy-6-metoxy-1,4-benzoquinol methylase
MIYDTINPEVVRFILQEKKSGAKILDVGCATGKLGKLLKSKIDCYLAGIEIDKEAADIARQSYDEVALINLEELMEEKCAFKGNTQYDFIVFGDILEHVTKPEALLKCFDNFLKHDGFLIVSIPNIANWMIRFQLLFGNFDYAGGILDQGHLRFFTYKAARKLLEDNGYKIIAVRNNNTTWFIRILGRIWKRMFAFQFVFKCRKIL